MHIYDETIGRLGLEILDLTEQIGERQAIINKLRGLRGKTKKKAPAKHEPARATVAPLKRIWTPEQKAEASKRAKTMWRARKKNKK